MLRRLLRADKFIVEFAATRNVELVVAFWRRTVRRALQNGADGALRPVRGDGSAVYVLYALLNDRLSLALHTNHDPIL